MWVLSKCFLQNQFLTNFDKVIAKNRFSSFSTFWNFCPYGCLQLKTIAVSSSSMDGNPLPFHWHQWLLSNHWNHWTQCIGWLPLKTIKSTTPTSPEPLPIPLSQNFTIDQVYFTQKSYLHKKEVRGALLPLCTVGKHKLPWRVTDQPHLPEILDPGDLKSVLERSGGLGVLQLIYLYNHKCYKKSTAKGESKAKVEK